MASEQSARSSALAEERGLVAKTRLVVTSLVLATAACVVVAGVSQSGALQLAELRGYDLFVPARSCAASRAIVIVDFDDVSVQKLNAFPVPRGILADLLQRIAAGQPQLVGLDVLLDKAREPADDARLARTIERAQNVILAEIFGTDDLPASRPLAQFRRGALDAAFGNLPLDPDGFVRRTQLWSRSAEYQGLSLSVALASNYWQTPLELGSDGTPHLGATRIPVDGTGSHSALIGDWCRQETVSVHRVLDPAFDAQRLKGRIVIVGQSSSTAKDLYPTPLFRRRDAPGGRAFFSGAELHAAALATILGERSVRIMDWRLLWTINLLFAWALIGVVIGVRPVLGAGAVFASGAGAFLLAHTLFAEQGMWMPFVTTELGIVLALPVALGYRFLRERTMRVRSDTERRELVGLFERYVSPEVAEEIWRRRSEIVLEGQERTATVLFSDIRDFTAHSAGRPSAEVLAWLNDYFDAMSTVVRRNGGMLNKFIGDGLLVVFGLPLSEGIADDARRAVRAAVDMLLEVERLNREGRPGWPHLAIGIGLHTGSLTVGNVGARNRMEYSVIGETVNLASRLEALTKTLKRGIVMSPDTRELVREHFDTVALGEVEVRGFPEKVRVFTIDRGAGAEEGV